MTLANSRLCQVYTIQSWDVPVALDVKQSAEKQSNIPLQSNNPWYAVCVCGRLVDFAVVDKSGEHHGLNSMNLQQTPIFLSGRCCRPHPSPSLLTRLLFETPGSQFNPQHGQPTALCQPTADICRLLCRMAIG